MRRPLRIAVVTNIPVPYRIPVYESIEARSEIDLTVLYCALREPDRHWQLPATTVPGVVLGGLVLHRRGRFIHVNPGVFRALDRLSPDVVLTTGYNPTHLLAVAYCALRRVPHIVQTDGTLSTESTLTPLHHAVRRLVRRFTTAYVGASDGSLALFRSWGVDDAMQFRSVLAVDNERFLPEHEKTVDFLFSGRLVPMKHPDFAIRVAEAAAVRLGRSVSMTIAGSGPLEEQVRALAEVVDGVDVELRGFVSQRDIPAMYGNARVLLFPTSGDAWGVVANEACAAGLPVLTTPSAGAANELVLDGLDGRILPLDVAAWADAAAELLENEDMRDRFGETAREIVGPYTFDRAADGIVEAAGAAVSARPRVLIDLLGAPARSGGMRLHATEIVQHWLGEWGDTDDVVVIGGSWVRGIPGIERASRVVTWPNDSPVARAVGQQLVTPLLYHLTRRQRLLATNSVLSLFSPARRSTLVAHDWRHVLQPGEFSRAQRLYRRWWRSSALRTRSLVCVSEKTRAESIRLLRRSDPVTIENGRDHVARWAIDSARPVIAPAGPFVVTFGHHTNKRPHLVIRAMASAELVDAPDLVVLGAQGELRDELRALAEEVGIGERVLLPGFVLSEVYQWLVANAAAIVVASSDEGFGLPLAEAAALGVPAVVARDSGVADLFAMTAIAAEPTPAGIAAALTTALSGPVQAPTQGQTWREVARRVRRVVLSGGGLRVEDPEQDGRAATPREPSRRPGPIRRIGSGPH